MPRYPVPAGTHRVDDEISRSRFITTVARADSVSAAQAFIQSIRTAFPDATHHCWAYVVGPPGSTAAVGLSDDGEPHGTAGRPMLNILLHSGVGDIAAVVTRYYGGTKLGTGGLVRAYSGGVARALEHLPRAERIEYVGVEIVMDYARVAAVEQLLPAFEVEIASRRFEADVRLAGRLPDMQLEAFRRAVLDATRGQGRVATVGTDGA